MVFKLKAVALIIFTYSVFAFSKEHINPFYINNVEIGFNFPINQISTSFFDAFNKYSSTTSSEFAIKNYPSFACKIEIPEITSFVLNFEWLCLNFATNFHMNTQYSYLNIARSYSENFEFNFFTTSLSFFYAPINDDFRTLLHFQIGASFDKILWNEYVSSEYDADEDKGLKTLQFNQLSPFAAFGIRNVLPFDLSGKDYLLQEFFFETRFCFSYRSIKLFSRISEAYQVPEKVTILPFSIVFLVGINLNTKSFFYN